MDIHIYPVAYKDVEAMRDLFRQEADCQIIHDSALPRGLADPYLIEVGGRRAGYGAVWNKYFKNRVMEFYAMPHLRGDALPLFRELLFVSEATHIEAQTNIPLMLMMLYDCARDIVSENLLFHEAFTSHLSCRDVIFRRVGLSDQGCDEDEWILEIDGTIVAKGGFLCHYNPPYGDVYMETVESMRGRGYGAYMVQELKRVCYEAGRRPAARCNPNNSGSRRTLEKAGLLPCGRLLAGTIEIVVDPP